MQRLVRVIAPSVDPLSWEEARDHLRLGTDTTESGYLDTLISVATSYLDGKDGLLGRCLIQQTWKLITENAPRIIPIPVPPLIALAEVSWTDDQDVIHLIDLDTIIVSGVGDSDPASICPRPGCEWPPYNTPLTITFLAGYGLSEDVPAPVKAAILLHVGHLYSNRESTISGTINELPFGYLDLINPYRQWSFG